MADRATLEETIALLEATLDATHDAILVVDLHGHVIRCNRRCFEMLGFAADDLARGRLDLILDRLNALRDDRDDTHRVRSTKELLSGDPRSEHLDVLHFKDGRILERYIAPHQVNGRVVGRVASFRDIGESVRAAEALDQHRAFLEQAQETAHIGSWVADLDGGGRAWWSAETYRIFGVSPETFEEPRQHSTNACIPTIANRYTRRARRQSLRGDGSTSSIASCGPMERSGGCTSKDRSCTTRADARRA